MSPTQHTPSSSLVPMREGDRRFLVSAAWYAARVAHEEAVEECIPSPGPVDNTPLVQALSTQHLRTDVEEREYVVVTDKEWERYVSQYGLKGPLLERPVVVRDQRPEVELFPLHISFCKKSDLTPSAGNNTSHTNGQNATVCNSPGSGAAAQSVTHPVSEPETVTGKKRKSRDGLSPPLHTVQVGEDWTVSNLLKLAASFLHTTPKNVRMFLASDFPDLDTLKLIPDVEPQDRSRKLRNLSFDNGDVVILEVMSEHLVETFPEEKEEEESSNQVGQSFHLDEGGAGGGSGGDGVWSADALAPGIDGRDYEGARPTVYNVEDSSDDELMVNHFTGQRTDVFFHRNGSNSPNFSFMTPNRTLTPETLAPNSSIPYGACGLRNLGNTCYMNAGLQCLAALPHLVDYFISDEFQHHVNRDNPLGWKGELAEAFAYLLKKMWSWKKHSSISPDHFKHLLGKINAQFRGFSQQDSQEFLAFLMDGLHEDLNRVTQKPFTEAIEGSAFGSPEEAAEEAWRRHMLRNDSLLVHLCQGQYRSTLTCSTCGKCSVTFDPYMNLSLPVPVRSDTLYNVYFIPLTGQITRGKVCLPKKSHFAALKQAVAEMFSLPSQHLVVREVFHSKFWSSSTDDGAVIYTSSNDDIFGFYEVNPLLDSGQNQGSSENGVQPASCNDNGGDSCAICYNDYEPSDLKSHAGCEEQKLCETCMERCEGDQSSGFIKCPFCQKEIPEMDWLSSGPPLAEISSDLIIRQQVFHVIVGTYSNDFAGIPFLINVRKKGAMGTIIHEQIRRHLLGRGLISPSSLEPEYEVFWFASADEAKSTTLSDNYCRKISDSVDEEVDFPVDAVVGIVWKDTEYIRDRLSSVVHHQSMSLHVDANRELTLSDCLEKFTKVELLGPDDPWYCSQCKEHKQASKHMEIWSRPDYLVIQLKRFHVAQGFYFREKIDCMVEYPFELDITPFIAGPQRLDASENVFDLVGVVNHMGGMGGGHYTAFTKNPCTGTWFECNDSSVETLPHNTVISRNAYVLFYQRKKCAERNPDLEGLVRTFAETGAQSPSPIPFTREPSASPLAIEGGSSTFSPIRPASSRLDKSGGEDDPAMVHNFMTISDDEDVPSRQPGSGDSNMQRGGFLQDEEDEDRPPYQPLTSSPVPGHTSMAYSFINQEDPLFSDTRGSSLDPDEG